MSKCKPCIFSQDAGVESLQTSFWDTDQSLPLNGTNTVAKSSEQESQTDGLQECQCGKETLSCSIHPNTKDEWIASMRDSLVKILAKPVVKEALGKIRDRDFTDRSYGLQTRYSLNTCSWKTSQASLVETTEECLEQSLEILPREATILSGVVYPLPRLVLIMSEVGGGYLHTPTATMNQNAPSMVRKSGWWPTPTAHTGQEGGFPAEFKRNSCLTADVIRAEVMEGKIEMWPTPNASDNRNRGNLNTPSVQNRVKKGKQITLSMMATTPQMWPTPLAHIAKENGCLSEHNRKEPSIASMVGGKLNPTWVEWLMGWPLFHTDLKR